MFNLVHPFNLMWREGNFDQLDSMRVLVVQDLDVVLLHLFASFMEVAVRFLNHIIDDQVVHLELVFIEILDDSFCLLYSESLRNGDDDEFRLPGVPDETDNLLSQVFPPTDDLKERFLSFL